MRTTSTPTSGTATTGTATTGTSTPSPLTLPSVTTAMDLLAAAGQSLGEAHWAATLHARYASTRVAVLRAAAAVLAVRGGPHRGRGPTPVWELLPRLAPELTEWAEHFAAALPEDPADGRGPVCVRVVDDLLRDGEEFTRIVARTLGLPPVPVTADLTTLTG